MALPLTGCSEPEPTLERIDVTTPPTKTVYAVGEPLDTTGMVVTATYSDGKIVEVTDYTTDGFDSATAGTQTVTVTYQGKDGNFTVTVNRLTVATPTASLAAGTYLLPQSVTLSTITAGAAIYYTLDGTTPSAASTLYSGAISISATTTLKAIAVKANFNNSSVLTITYNFSATTLTADTWADGNLTTANSREQWFKFTATATTSYIYFQPDTLTSATGTVYGEDGTTAVTAGSISTSLSSTNPSISRTTEVGKDYYIKVSASYSTGTYKIAFNNLTLPPSSITIPTTGVNTLSANVWTDGNITTAGGEQLFKFTASATTHYIHFYTGTLSSVYVQRYDADGRLISGTWNGTNLSGTSLYATQESLTTSNVYYIKVSSSYSTGTYKITFSTTTTTPDITVPTTTATTLTLGTWNDTGNITASGEQWFKFTVATAGYHYIHFQPGTPTNNTYYVQVFKSDNKATEGAASLSTSTLRYTTVSLSTGDYYIRISSQGDAGTYSIAVTGAGTSNNTPPAIENFSTLTSSATTLTGWTTGNIPTANGDQWFKITTSSTTQNIYFRTGQVVSVYVRLYTSTGVLVGPSMTSLTYGTFNTYRTVTGTTDYYLRVTANNSTGGSYKIGTSLPPTEDATLTINQWTNGTIGTPTTTAPNVSGDQWFKFTATATSHYIHFQTGTLNDVYVQLYNADGTTNGSSANLYGSGTNLYTQRTGLTVNSTYFIRVRPFYTTSAGGAYKIGFTTSTTAPTN